MQPARECLTHAPQCGRETKCAHQEQLARDPVCATSRVVGAEGAQTVNPEGVGVARVDAVTSDSATTPSAKKGVQRRAHSTPEAQPQHTQALPQ